MNAVMATTMTATAPLMKTIIGWARTAAWGRGPVGGGAIGSVARTETIPSVVRPLDLPVKKCATIRTMIVMGERMNPFKESVTRSVVSARLGSAHVAMGAGETVLGVKSRMMRRATIGMMIAMDRSMKI
tara:strand:- start:1158 stop:1544 length:387 start_codon:yes stop_codon:yes gene_type:complete